MDRRGAVGAGVVPREPRAPLTRTACTPRGPGAAGPVGAGQVDPGGSGGCGPVDPGGSVGRQSTRTSVFWQACSSQAPSFCLVMTYSGAPSVSPAAER